MTRLRWLSVLLALLLSGVAAAADPPNLVLVIGDDHAWPDAGFMGHPLVKTPALDRLAAGGTVFTDAQLPASTCRPSLQTLLSGLHPEQWRAKRRTLAAEGPIPFRQEVVHYRTLPRELARRGYRSWQGGKMWEGSYAQAGFDAGSAAPGPFGPFESRVPLGRQGWDPARCGATRTRPGPCPALRALRRFLDGVGDAPFFLWFAPMLPHAPFDPPPAFVALYEGAGLDHAHVLYYAQVSRLDAVVGELMRELEARGRVRDTLVVYVSDNGWQVGQGRLGQYGHGKASLHELGTRTPIVFYGPGRVPAGVRRDELVSVESLFPTLLDYAGAPPLPDRRGVSLRPAIESAAEAPSPGLDAYVSFYKGIADKNTGYWVRTPDWRYSVAADGREQLYAIRDDPLERVDLADREAERLPGFRVQIEAWKTEIAAAPPRLEVAGRLEDERGRAIPGVGLVLESQGGAQSARFETVTDAHGAFVFREIPHGDYRLAPGRGLSALVGDVAVRLPVGPTGSYLPHLVGTRTRVGADRPFPIGGS